MKKINFGNPINGRKWLKLLVPYKQYGMTFHKNMDISKKYLGFSFKSNKFGLRGPNNINADNVICGTSFAMGLSVDNGKNWYELGNFNNYFNIGMPIGPNNHINILNDLYKGKYKKIIFIYHPNIWDISKSFYKAQYNDCNIFTQMKWKTDILSIIYLYFRWLIKEPYKKIFGLKSTFLYKGTSYDINNLYSIYNYENNSKYAKIAANQYNELFDRFKEVVIFKVPIKEQVAHKYIKSDNLNKLNENYELMWNVFKKNIKHDNLTFIDLTENFSMNDYLPSDTHWSEDGNKTFFTNIKEKI